MLKNGTGGVLRRRSYEKRFGGDNMVFSSLFFLYMFLALNLLIYALTPTIKAKNIVLLFFSLVFYAFTGPRYLLLLAGMTAVSWFCALQIERAETGTARRKVFLCLDIILLLGLLCLFKYTGFLLGNLQLLTGLPEVLPQIVLPIGISFYTFQLLSYTVDVYRQEITAQRNYFHLLLYASLFHQCIAGPIVRYKTVSSNITKRSVSAAKLSEGILRFCIGLAKKAVLANTCASIAKELIPSAASELESAPVLSLWLGLFCFMLQIYLDFSAYSDMAIGMGNMIGFHYNENFNYPYIANSITDFWRRWHISLSSFFRDYIYIPLGGNRKGMLRTLLNLFIVWALTGLWHGGSWNFILWGLYYFIFLVLEKSFLLKTLEKLPACLRPLRHIYTLLVVFFGWIIFYFEQLPALGAALRAMLSFGSAAHPLYSIQTVLQFKNHVFFLIIAILCCLPLYRILHERLEELAAKHIRILHFISVFDIATIIFCICISTLALVGNSYNPFLYFRF